MALTGSPNGNIHRSQLTAPQLRLTFRCRFRTAEPGGPAAGGADPASCAGPGAGRRGRSGGDRGPGPGRRHRPSSGAGWTSADRGVERFPPPGRTGSTGLVGRGGGAAAVGPAGRARRRPVWRRRRSRRGATRSRAETEVTRTAPRNAVAPTPMCRFRPASSPPSPARVRPAEVWTTRTGRARSRGPSSSRHVTSVFPRGRSARRQWVRAASPRVGHTTRHRCRPRGGITVEIARRQRSSRPTPSGEAGRVGRQRYGLDPPGFGDGSGIPTRPSSGARLAFQRVRQDWRPIRSGTAGATGNESGCGPMRIETGASRPQCNYRRVYLRGLAR